MYVDSDTIWEAVRVREKEITEKNLSQGSQYWYLQGQIDILSDLLDGQGELE